MSKSNKNSLLSGLGLLIGFVLVAAAGVMLFGDMPHGDEKKIAKHPKQMDWSFDGVTGNFDRQSIQRGFQVYKEVCSACHGMKRIAFRTLQDIGFSEAETKALAAEYTFTTINDEGEEVERPGLPSDKFPSPFANEQAARAANGGAYPPDMSLLVKARPDGANYIYSLLTGYGESVKKVCTEFDDSGDCSHFRDATEDDLAKAEEEKQRLKREDEALRVKAKAEYEANAEAEILAGAPDTKITPEIVEEHVGNKLASWAFPTRANRDMPAKTYSCEKREDESLCIPIGVGMHYNPYYEGRQIAMAAPLSDGIITYEDGTEATVEQSTHDLVTFLQWAAEPEMEDRKQMGIRVLIFLTLLTILFYIAKKRIWKDVE